MSNGFPKTYRKGDQIRVANSPASAVKAEFDGFRLESKPKRARQPRQEQPEAVPDEGPTTTDEAPQQ